MTAYIDQKYLNLLKTELELFVVKSPHPFLANCRCKICGDSRKNKFKARGYFYIHQNNLLYKCHNCNYSTNFAKFLKEINRSLYNQYCTEKFFNKEDKSIEHEVPKVQTKSKSFLDQLFDPVFGTEAEQYLKKRKIPLSHWKNFYYIDDVSKIKHEKYKDRIKANDSRLIIPFYTKQGALVGFTCRALRPSNMRYINIKINPNHPMIYNWDQVDESKIIYVVEGQLDSTFLPNSVAAGNGDLVSTASHFPKNNCILIFDNQPRNKEICKMIQKGINEKYKIVIWPSYIEEKDINEIILAGTSRQKLLDIVEENTYNQLNLELQFSKWKKINGN